MRHLLVRGGLGSPMATVRGWMKAPGRWFLLAFFGILVSSFGSAAPSNAPSRKPSQGTTRVHILVTGSTFALAPEACGCRSRDIGLAQRAGFVSRLRARFTPSLLIDTGDLATRPEALNVVAGVLRAVGYSAVVVGPLDLAVGRGTLDAAGLRPLLLPEHPPAAATPRGRVFTVGQVRVGIVAAAVSPDAPGALEDALSAVPALRAQSDVVIVACRATAKQVAAQLGTRSRAGVQPPDVVLGIGPRATLVRLGRCAFVCPDPDPAVVHRLTLEMHGRRKSHTTWQTYRVSPHSPADPAAQRIVDAFYGKQEKALLAEYSRDASPQPASLQCGECHAKAVAWWRADLHARAAQTLKSRHRLVPQCLPCHSETYATGGGKLIAAGGLADGIQCTSCHSPALEQSAPRQVPHQRLEVSEAACRRCHKPNTSPDFDFAVRRERIRHW